MGKSISLKPRGGMKRNQIKMDRGGVFIFLNHFEEKLLKFMQILRAD